MKIFREGLKFDHNPIIRLFKASIQHYNKDKYWKRRAIVVDPQNNTNVLLKLYYLYYIKKCDAYNNASMGTDLNSGARFASPPEHGLNGIIISHFADIGRDVTIYQQVTVAQDSNNKSATIEDNVFIGAGAKIIGNVRIGHHSLIGANAVVTHDIPPYSVAVGVPARVIKTLEHEKEA